MEKSGPITSIFVYTTVTPSLYEPRVDEVKLVAQELWHRHSNIGVHHFLSPLLRRCLNRCDFLFLYSISYLFLAISSIMQGSCKLVFFPFHYAIDFN